MNTVKRPKMFSQRAAAAVLLSFAATVLGSAASAQSNVLVNGDFESNPPAQMGDHPGYPITPWVVGQGDTPNVVKVDGPGGHNYGSSGPESDASAPGAGVPQHYLDILGKNSFYQSFTPRCPGRVEFGGSFSTRDNLKGSGSVTLRQGVGLAGTIVGATNNINLAAGTSKTDPWKLVSFTAPITAGVTYSFIVNMDNNLISITVSSDTRSTAILRLLSTRAARPGARRGWRTC